jgi:hypothetical protein
MGNFVVAHVWGGLGMDAELCHGSLVTRGSQEPIWMPAPIFHSPPPSSSPATPRVREGGWLLVAGEGTSLPTGAMGNFVVARVRGGFGMDAEPCHGSLVPRGSQEPIWMPAQSLAHPHLHPPPQHLGFVKAEGLWLQGRESVSPPVPWATSSLSVSGEGLGWTPACGPETPPHAFA